MFWLGSVLVAHLHVEIRTINPPPKYNVLKGFVVVLWSLIFSYGKIFVDSGWESLQIRRNTHNPLLFYKKNHGIAPNYLSEVVSPLVQETRNNHL